MRGAHDVPPNAEAGIAGYKAGYCHRTPPVMAPELHRASHRPVRLIGWCGEWRFSLRAWWRALRRR